jgi:hypothetical protein
MQHTHPWMSFLPIIAWIAVLAALIVRKRKGKWKRPNTFKPALILMSLAIAASTAAAVLEFYGH